jgi:PEP-CTERM motif
MAFKQAMLAAAAVAGMMAAVPASAVQVVFAEITLVDADRNFLWARSTGSNATLNTFTRSTLGATEVRFSLVGSPIPVSVLATLTLTGSTNGDPLTATTGPFAQQVDSFGFTITTNEAFCFGPNCFNVGDSLLSAASVLNSTITGTLGQRTATFSGSTETGTTLSYSSPLLIFEPGTNYGFDFALTDIDRNLAGSPVTSLGSFRGQISGTFSADPSAVFNVPEPGTWALMITGMGLVGLARRRRRTVVAA